MLPVTNFLEATQRQMYNMTDVLETQLLINNKLVPASDNSTFELFSPHTGDLIAKGKSRDKIVLSTAP